MPKVEVRMYQRLWEKIRDSKRGTTVVVFAPEQLHRRITKALRNERARDTSFKIRDERILHIKVRDTASLEVQWKLQSGIEAGEALSKGKPLFEFYNVETGHSS